MNSYLRLAVCLILFFNFFYPVYAQDPITSDTIQNLLIDGMEKGIRGDYQGAIAVFNQIIALDSQEVEAYFNRGIAYKMINQPAKAIADFNTTIALDRNYADAYLQRGQIYLTLSQKDKAITDLQTALRLFQEQENWAAYQAVQSQLDQINPDNY